MKDVEKTSVERQNSRKRIRRRQRWMNVYGLVVLLLVVTAGITISYTFLFNINEIRVAGQSDMYSAEEIVEASGIKEGDNLLRLDCAKSEQRILDELLYVETAKVKRDFPSSLEITVSRCIPAFNVNYDGGTLLVSKKGKILADNGFITPDLPIIYGLDPSERTPGRLVASDNEHKNDAFTELIASMVSMGEDKISTVDMSDEHSIIVKYKNSMIGTNQCSFRTSDDPAAVPGIIEPTTATPTDEYGYPIIQGEHDPKQEEQFIEHNNNLTTEPTTTAASWTPEDNTQQWQEDGGPWQDSGYDDGSQWQDYGDYGYDTGGSGYDDGLQQQW